MAKYLFNFVLKALPTDPKFPAPKFKKKIVF